MNYKILCTFGLPEDYESFYPDFSSLEDSDIELCLYSLEQNVQLGVDQIVNVLRRRLNSLEYDLIEIASLVYLADIGCARGKNEFWIRNLNFLIPVRNRAAWEENKELLTKVISNLTGDNIQFNFIEYDNQSIRISSRHTPRRFRDKKKRRKPKGDCVSLLSGGIDSLGGAIELIESGRHPIFVRHYNYDHTQSRNLVNILSTYFDEDYYYMPCFIGKKPQSRALKQYEPAEPSQRARSFMFLSLGVIASNNLQNDVKEVYINENGNMAIHLPLSKSRVGSFSTHTAHPKVLNDYEKLVCSVFNEEYRIRNLLVGKTKKEIINDIGNSSLDSSLIETVSCGRGPDTVRMMASRISRPTNIRHCGTCIPCINRRISFLVSNHTSDDSNYLEDCFLEIFELTNEKLSNVIDTIRLAFRFLFMSDQKLIRKYPDLIETERFGFSTREAIDLYRRFAIETRDAVLKANPDLGILLDIKFQRRYEREISVIDPLDMLADIANSRQLALTGTAEKRLMESLNRIRWKIVQSVYSGEMDINDVQSALEEHIETIAELAEDKRARTISNIDIKKAEDEQTYSWP